METQASSMNHIVQPKQQSHGEQSVAATSASWRALLALSWYPSVPGRQLTLRYPGCQRHGSGAVQANVRGRTSRRKPAGPRTV